MIMFRMFFNYFRAFLLIFIQEYNYSAVHGNQEGTSFEYVVLKSGNKILHK